ncbi:MAG: DUF4214 domain-containing protein [Clostridia bacterium]|nr:DUF4214 domain-containing protein [Clostridia bacterium]
MRKERIASAILAVLCFVSTILLSLDIDVYASPDEKDYWRGYSSRYYYDNVLDDTQRSLYDLFDFTYEEVLLSDDYFEYAYVDLSSYKFDSSEETLYYVNDMLILAIHCNPQYFFWWIPAPVYEDVDGERCLVGYILGIMPDFRNGTDRVKAREEVKAVLDSYINAVPENALPEEKEKIIHDLMCEKISYGDYILPSGMSFTQSIYSAVKGSTVCQGYADLFQGLMNKVGVECTMTGGHGHAWDLINLHGYWFIVDVTADDCFNPYGYVCYNGGKGYEAEGLFATMSSHIPLPYDNLDDDPLGNYSYTNYSSRYIQKDSDTFFVLNDLDDDKGRLAVLLDKDHSDVKWIAYNGKTYKVINFKELEQKSDFSEFVERLYVVALGRDSEKEGKEFWCEHVGNGDLTGADCAREFLNSKEFTDKELSDEEFVKILYRVFFNREAIDDLEGYEFWLNSLETVDKKTVVDGFINSKEWEEVCSSFGVRSGARLKRTSASNDAIAFATRLYTECLGRDPENEGLEFWSLGLSNHELTGSQAAREFFYSKEFIGLGLDDKEYVKRLYKTFMGREPEEEGFNFWINELSNGLTRDEVFEYFCVCPEFTQICEKYSITR